MYCKHCGKLIADDSVFCQYCGKKQDIIIVKDESYTESEQNEVFNKVELKPTYRRNEFAIFNAKYHKYWIIYAIWVSLNVIIWNLGNGYVEVCPFCGYEDNKPSSYLYPLRHCTDYDIDDNVKIYKAFDPSTYDITEFILYVIILPLLIIVYFKYLHKPLKKKNIQNENELNI